jgi:hypothetical protein
MSPVWILPIIGTVIIMVIVALGLLFEMGESEDSDLINTKQDED